MIEKTIIEKQYELSEADILLAIGLLFKEKGISYPSGQFSLTAIPDGDSIRLIYTVKGLHSEHKK